MSSYEVSTEEFQGIYGGVGKIWPALPKIGLNGDSLREKNLSYKILLVLWNDTMYVKEEV